MHFPSLLFPSIFSPSYFLSTVFPLHRLFSPSSFLSIVFPLHLLFSPSSFLSIVFSVYVLDFMSFLFYCWPLALCFCQLDLQMDVIFLPDDPLFRMLRRDQISFLVISLLNMAIVEWYNHYLVRLDRGQVFDSS